MTRCDHGRDEDYCETCYADDVARATSPPPDLARDLADLEATNPEVAAAGVELDRTKQAIGRRGVAAARAAMAKDKPAPPPTGDDT